MTRWLAWSFDRWLEFGMRRGWCGTVVCQTHDGTPLTVEEELAFDDGNDVCVHVIRVFSTYEEQQDATNNHLPSQWRHRNRRNYR